MIITVNGYIKQENNSQGSQNDMKICLFKSHDVVAPIRRKHVSGHRNKKSLGIGWTDRNANGVVE